MPREHRLVTSAKNWWRRMSLLGAHPLLAPVTAAGAGKPSRRRDREHLRNTRLWTPEPLEPRQMLAGEVLINEIMYHAQSQDQRDEWIEFFNPGVAPINLSGWRIDAGADYTFGNVTINGGGYLVVAADLAMFQAKYPGVTNVVGGYVGRLSNSGEEIRLENAGGVPVDSVSFAEEGEWGIRTRGPLDHGHRGWDWTAEHDGLGKSLELINTAVSNDYGQNWRASNTVEGTPGTVNSVAAGNIAPLIVDVSHFPAIPKSTDPVTIRARIIDELPLGALVSLFHRVDGAPSFTQSPMFDDGLHGDGFAGDGVYAAILLPQPDDTVVEFYVHAMDPALNVRTYPAPSQPTGEQLTNLLYQVDDSVYTGDQPIFRLIMTEAERAELADIGSDPSDGIAEQDSDAQMNGTFISVDGTGTEVRYLVGIRNRGKGSRNDQPNNYRVNLPADKPWHDVTAVVFNGRYSGLEVVGSEILRFANVPAQDVVPAQVRVNNNDLAAQASPNYRMFGSYGFLESLDSEFAENHYPQDSSGNLYRGFDELVYRGEEPDAYRAELHNGVGYEKHSNSEEDDWTDIIELMRTFDVDETPDDNDFVTRIQNLIDVDQWLKAFALHELIGNRENSLPIGEGDDYSLYRGTIDTRFKLIAHDLDTILGIGDTPGGTTQPIFRATAITALNRLLKHPAFAPTYFKYLKELSDTVLAPETINPLLDNWLTGYFTPDRIADAKNFLVARRNHIFNSATPLVPLAVSAASTLPVTNGYFTSITNATDLSGKANAIDTRKVLVNGVEATWTAWQASWTAASVSLHPGVNRILVQALDSADQEIERTYIDVFYNTGTMTDVGGALPAGETHWTVAGGPFHVTATITVPAGSTLRIDPGVTVFFDVGAGISVSGGQLLAEGTDLERIRFAKTPGAASNWRGLSFNSTTQDNRLAYVDQEAGDVGFGSGARSVSVLNSVVNIDHMNWLGTTARILDFVDSSFRVSNSTLPNVGAVEPVHGEGVPDGGFAIFENNRFGRNSGFNDIMDFSDVHRPGAVLQLINNVFEGGEDDILDLDGCDAYIEGNVFKNTHLTNPANPDTSSAVSGGQFGGQSANWTIVRNFFYNLDHAVLAKEGVFATLINNTMVNIAVAAINFDEPLRTGITPGLGASLDGNIIWATPLVFENVNSDGSTTQLTVNRSILPTQTVFPGVGNSNVDPHLFKTTGVTDPRQDLRIEGDFGPARKTGPFGRDMGADVPAGAAISGVPSSPTFLTDATLLVGGPEIAAYRFRHNNGPWSAPIAAGTPIVLSGLSDGLQRVEVVAQNQVGVWQADADAAVALWGINTALAPRLRVSEILAQNSSSVLHEGSFRDMVEIVNEGAGTADLFDMSLTDDPNVPRKFVFTTHVTLAAGQRLILFADDADGSSGIHLGFGLDKDGEGLYLYDSVPGGGEQLDGVGFGTQLEDVSLVRRPDSSWGLGAPSFGAANTYLPMGNASNLKINEWLASAAAPFNNDFIEVFNSDTLPVDMGGLYITDQPDTWPDRHQIAPLTFVAGSGLYVFTADGDPQDGPDHVDFKLNSDQGLISLFGPSFEPIDQVLYTAQRTNRSQGRSPNGDPHWAFFAEPNPGLNNPSSNATVETINLIPIDATGWKYNQIAQFNDSAWAQPGFNDSDPIAWPTGQSAIARDSDAWPANVPKNTILTANRTTFYFRRKFNVASLDDVTALLLRTAVDDGAVVWLNGHEVLRHQMPAAPTVITYATRSTRSPTSWDTQIEGTFTLDKQWLVEGENLLAVEVHQATGSNDMGFAVILDLQRTIQPADPPPLRITELNYHPFDPTPEELLINPTWTSEDFEFIEVLNVGASEVNLAGVKLAQAVDFTFPAISLPAGERIVILRNQAAFTARYGGGINVAGEYSNTLSDSSEPISLVDSANQLIQHFVYSDSGAWPGRPDGLGSTLEIVNPLTSAATADNWRASTEYGGTPGTAGLGIVSNIVINEVLTHTDPPLVDAIELYNPTASPIDVSGWYLSDDSDSYKKFRIPNGIIIAAGGYLVFDEDDFNPTPGIDPSFSFSSARGDDAWLVRADAAGKLLQFIDHVEFPAAANGESFGRWPNASGNLYPMDSRTLGTANSGPRIGPVVISEIMYNPNGGNDDLEYIELRNITGAPVDMSNWKIDRGVDFTFAPGTVIPADGVLVLVRFDPTDPANEARLTTFRDTYGLAPTIPLLGGYGGALNGAVLDNGGETVRLARPDMPQPDQFVPYLLVDELSYDDSAPWPIGPDGNGPSLTRISTATYGQDPTNWVGGTPSPGTVAAPAAPSNLIATSTGANRVHLAWSDNSGNETGFRIERLDGANWISVGVVDVNTTSFDATKLKSSTNHQFRVRAVNGSGESAPSNTAGAQTGVLSVITGTSGDDTYHLVRIGNELLIYENEAPGGQPTYSSDLAALPATLGLNTLGGDDTVIVNAPAGVVLGPLVEFLPGPGVNSLQVTGGIASIDSAAAGTEILDTTVSGSAELLTARFKQNSLELLGTSRATLRSNNAPVSVLGSLSLGPETTLDLKGNDLIVRASEATKDDVHADLQAKIVSAQNGVDANFITNWNGPGLTSSTARIANVATNFDLVALGLIRNSDLDTTTGLPGSTYTSFGGEPVSPHDVLVKYTYTGDGNLDGAVTFDDYAAMDATFFESIPIVGWASGDINFDNAITFDDYAAVDQAFFQQGAPLSEGGPSAQLFAGDASASLLGTAAISASSRTLNPPPGSADEKSVSVSGIGLAPAIQAASDLAEGADQLLGIDQVVKAGDSLADARLASSARSPSRAIWDEALAGW